MIAAVSLTAGEPTQLVNGQAAAATVHNADQPVTVSARPGIPPDQSFTLARGARLAWPAGTPLYARAANPAVVYVLP